MQKMEIVPMVSNKKTTMSANYQTKLPATRAGKNKDMVELVRIRETLGMTLEVYAAELGLLSSTLNAYVYGRTKSIPPEVMDKARQLEAKSKSDNPYLMEAMDILSKSGDAPLGKFLTRTREETGLDNEALSKIMGVSLTTLNRWERGSETLPSFLSRCIKRLRTYQAAQAGA